MLKKWDICAYRQVLHLTICSKLGQSVLELIYHRNNLPLLFSFHFNNLERKGPSRTRGPVRTRGPSRTRAPVRTRGPSRTRGPVRTRGPSIRFILEVSRKEQEQHILAYVLVFSKLVCIFIGQEDEFTQNSLHHIVCNLMQYLCNFGKSGIDFFSWSWFGWKTTEALMSDEEEILWKRGLLGDASPQTLLDTMMFYNGLFFALHSGKEHRPSQLKNS